MPSDSSMFVSRTMRLFGIPAQFTKEVDPRFSDVSPIIGRKYIENILLEAPIVTIIPGLPYFLPAVKDKQSVSAYILKAANGFTNITNNIQDVANLDENEVFRYYDFQPAYTEYMKYVNILCRTLATFLELDQTIDGKPLQSYDWRDYAGYGSHESVLGNLASSVYNTVTGAIGDLINGRTEEEAPPSDGQGEMVYETTTSSEGGDEEDGVFIDAIQDLLSNYNFVQFYADKEQSGVNEGFGNSTSESLMKGMFDSGSNLFKEISFIANSAVGDENLVNDMGEFLDTSLDSLASNLGGNSLTGILSRFINVSSNVVKGENVIMPDVWQSSEYSKTYQLTIHLKSIYGTKFGWFLQVGVPWMHALALAIPKQTTANTYGSPFLVKATMDGIFVCNLGIVSELSINKNVNPESWTVDGLPNEVDIQMSITDLYSDLSMSPQSDPLLFVNNTSLVEYLAISCGLSILAPNIKTKADMYVNTIANALGDIDDNIVSSINEIVDNWFAQIGRLG